MSVSDSDVCSICLAKGQEIIHPIYPATDGEEEFARGMTFVKTIEQVCQHIFCEDCLRTWTTKTNNLTCPYCRRIFTTMSPDPVTFIFQTASFEELEKKVQDYMSKGQIRQAIAYAQSVPISACILWGGRASNTRIELLVQIASSEDISGTRAKDEILRIISELVKKNRVLIKERSIRQLFDLLLKATHDRYWTYEMIDTQRLIEASELLPFISEESREDAAFRLLKCYLDDDNIHVDFADEAVQIAESLPAKYTLEKINAHIKVVIAFSSPGLSEQKKAKRRELLKNIIEFQKQTKLCLFLDQVVVSLTEYAFFHSLSSDETSELLSSINNHFHREMVRIKTLVKR
jgi:hypothetical protein